MVDFLQDLGNFTVFSSMFCGLIYFISFTKNGRAYKIFTIYLFLVSIILISSYYVGKGGLRQSNLFLSHYYFIIQFILLSLFYSDLLKFKWIYILMILVLIFLGYQYIQDPSIYFRYNPLGMTLTQIILVGYTILYFYRSLTNKEHFVWINAGLFFYLLPSTLIFASGNLVFNLNISATALNSLLDFNTVLYLIFQVLVLIEWYKNYWKRPLIKIKVKNKHN